MSTFFSAGRSSRTPAVSSRSDLARERVREVRPRAARIPRIWSLEDLHLRPTPACKGQTGCRWSVRATLAIAAVCGLLSGTLALGSSFSVQTLGSSGTVRGTVLDPSGALFSGAAVELSNAVSGFRRTTTTDPSGHFEFTNVPFNPYRLSISSEGFRPAEQAVTVRSSVPIELKLTLDIATESSEVTVQAGAGGLVEDTPVAHTDLDSSLIDKLPIENATIGMSQVVTNATPGVAADANGFFHPLGDHAQAAVSLDNQPINDQNSKLFSNQLSLDAIQSMEVISGVPPAEYGDKTSLVIDAVTKSGLGESTPHGSFSSEYGSFGTSTEALSLGLGGDRWGNFLAANVTNTRRFLDSPEFEALHDRGNGQGLFDRIDYQPTASDSLHLNLSFGRSWFQIPNTYTQAEAGQDQRQQIRTMNVAPGWTHLFNTTTLLTSNLFFRLDHVQYFPSRDPFADVPATLSQDRRLAALGGRADLSYSQGMHNARFGIQLQHHLLTENFDTGLTDPAYNPVCLDLNGNPVTDPSIAATSQCAAGGFQANPNLLPGLVPYDLTRGGSLFHFHRSGDIKELSFYGQDAMKIRNLNVNVGLRADFYRGLSRANQFEPRIGIAYLIQPTTTVLRLSYGRFLETPYNENLLLSSATGAGGLAEQILGALNAVPLEAGRRNQFNAGFQQAFGRWIVVNADYFWKYTRNAYDFDVLFNTPLTFPIEWRKSKIDGLGIRINLAGIHGFSAYSVMGHTRSRFFGPENGGLIFNSPLDTGVFRIDHDQAFQQSTHLQYQLPGRGPWVALTWRYDSGQVAGAVPDLETALSLSGDQQAAIGFHCGSAYATASSPISTCDLPYPQWGATRLRIPAPGTFNADTNPPRIAPRNLFDLGLGFDNILDTDRYQLNLRLTALNLTNEVALYNFLSTFSGTHFVTPRALQAEVKLVF